MSHLPKFHGKPCEDPYQYAKDHSQECEIGQVNNIPLDVMNMKYFLPHVRIKLRIDFYIYERNSLPWMEGKKIF